MSHSSGAYGRSVFLDVIDEVCRTPNTGGNGARANRTMESLVKRYVAKCEKLLRQFERNMRVHTKRDELWVPDADFVKSMMAVGKSIDDAWDSMRRARKDEKAEREGLTEEQLDAIAISQLTRFAGSMADEHKRIMLTRWFGAENAEKLLPYTNRLIEPAAKSGDS